MTGPTTPGRRRLQVGAGRGFPVAVNDQLQHGQYGEAYVRALALAWGFQCGVPDLRDLLKADLQIFYPGRHDGRANPSVLAQVKTASNPRRTRTGVSIQIDRETFDVLTDPTSEGRRAFVIVTAPPQDVLAKVGPRRTVFLRAAYWVDPLTWRPSAAANPMVSAPLANLLDRDGMETMVTTVGRSRSTAVPAVEDLRFGGA